MIELRIQVDGRAVMVRDTGERDHYPLVHFHGTPGSRLEADFGSEVAKRLGVRVISFDRPGYGFSDAAPSTLSKVARDVEAVVDGLDVGHFAAMGWSGGGPFALATAAILHDRVAQVGVSGGPAPVQKMPGADLLTENDLLALAYLPDDPARAAQQFQEGNRELLDAMMSVKDDPEAPWIDWIWGDSDPDVVTDQTLREAFRLSFSEALRQGPSAIAWDNVAYVGPWDFDLAEVACPVHLWHGGNDQMVPVQNAEWLAAHLQNPELQIYPGEGHLLPMRHWHEMLQALIPDGR